MSAGTAGALGTAAVQSTVDLSAARRGLGVLALASAGAGGLNYAFLAVMGVLLPAGQFVTVAAGQGLLLVVGSAAASTVPWLTAQQLARTVTPQQRADAARVSVLTAGALAVVAAAGTAAVAGFADPSERAVLALAAASVCLGQVGVGWAQGSGRFRLLASLVVGEVVLKVGVGVAAALAGAGALGVLASAAAGAALLVVAGVVLVGPRLAPRRAPGPDRTAPPSGRAAGTARSRGLEPGWWRTPLAVGSVRSAAAALMVVDVVLVALVLPAGRDVADYQLAMSLGRAPVFLATAVGQAYLAVLAARPRDAAPRRETWHRLVALALPAAAVIATVPTWWLARVLPGGEGVATYLPLAAGTGLVMALVQMVTTWGQVGQRLPRLATVLALACAVQGVLVLLGSRGGALGVAAATCTGALLALLVLLALTSTGVRLRLLPGLWPVASVLALVVLRPFPLVWLGAALCLGALVLRSLLRPAEPGDGPADRTDDPTDAAAARTGRVAS